MMHVICEGCGSKVPFTRERNAHGFRVKARCSRCDKPANPGRVWYQLSAFQEHELRTMPIEGEPAVSRCGFCDEDAPLEQHHLFPREAYQGDCEKGPKIDLCGKCHAEWHARMRRIGFVGELREMRSGGQGELADAIARAHDAWKRRPRTDRGGETLPLRAEPSKALAERIERARKASLGEDDDGSDEP